jgi:hypothetical protein
MVPLVLDERNTDVVRSVPQAKRREQERDPRVQSREAPGQPLEACPGASFLQTW